MESLVSVIGGLAALLVLDLLALRFGVGSRDGQREVWW